MTYRIMGLQYEKRDEDPSELLRRYGDDRPVQRAQGPSRTNSLLFEIIGVGDSFSTAWNDAHRVCEKRNCHITSCGYKEESKAKLPFAMWCHCSYKIGNTCGGRIGDTGNPEELIAQRAPESLILERMLQGNVSSILEQADQICNQKLRETPNVPAQAVAFAHDCAFFTTGRQP